MSDYIKKEDAAERVAFELMYEAAIAKGLSYKELFELEAEKQERIKLHILQKCLEQVPSADVVEVVRCKDCKYEKTCCRNIIDDPEGVPAQIDYCSYGKQKEQEHEL